VDVFRQEVGFEIDRITGLAAAEGGYGQSMGNQGDAEGLVRHIHDRQADPIDSNRTLGHHLTEQVGGTAKPDHDPVAVCLAALEGAHCIDMSLHEMAAQAIAEPQGAFEVDPVAGLHTTQVRPSQRLGRDLKGAGLRIGRDHGQTGPIDRHAFPESQLAGKGWDGDHQTTAGALGTEGADGAQRFNKSRKHDVMIEQQILLHNPRRTGWKGTKNDLIRSRKVKPVGEPCWIAIRCRWCPERNAEKGMLIAMAGLPGTGKSTLAARLKAELQAILLNKDEVRAVLFPQPALDYSRTQDDLVMQAIYSATACILRGHPERVVILDGRTFLRSYQVHDLAALALEVGQPARIIECVCADEVARARLVVDQRQGTHPAGNRTYDLYCTVKAQAEPLTFPHLVVDTGVLNVEECVRRCLEYLGRPVV
jgi:predicted kinase